MKDLEIINYDNCITNMTSSIQKFYNLEPNYKTNKILDELLAQKKYKNVIVFVFDGMGNAIIDKHTTQEHFLRQKRVGMTQSTFPPTTANCTTAYLTGLNPITTGWLGWSTYYKDLDMAIDNFTNQESVTKKIVEGDNVAQRKLPYTELGKTIEASTKRKVKYHVVMPSFAPGGCKDLEEFQKRIIKICRKPGRHYIYAYWDDPDHTMHEFGTKDERIKHIIDNIGETLRKIEKKTRKTIGIASADHGMVDVVPIHLHTFIDIMSTLSAPVTCDARTAFFFVKEEYKKSFKKLFQWNFGNNFIILSKEEALENHIFGFGKENSLLNDVVGDFVAISKSKYYFSTSLAADDFIFKGHHAGILNDEMSIPIIVIKN